MSLERRKLLDAWFVEEVLPLEPLLTGYLRRNSREPDAVADLRQDVYVRIYEAAEKELPLQVRAFVFTVARHLLIDRARHSQVAALVSAAPEAEGLEPVNELDPERQLLGRERLGLFARALAALPPRCREVVELRKLGGLSQREIAEQLGISEGTVEKQIAKGVRTIADAMGGTPPKDKVAAAVVVPLPARRECI
jgi:RNA polymerase sigma-70 factor (ECF subfamily)